MEHNSDQPVLTATIIGNSDPEQGDDSTRITIACFKQSDGHYSWYGPTVDDPLGPPIESAEVGGWTIEEAKMAAARSWDGPAWNLEADWL